MDVVILVFIMIENLPIVVVYLLEVRSEATKAMVDINEDNSIKWTGKL